MSRNVLGICFLFALVLPGFAQNKTLTIKNMTLQESIIVGLITSYESMNELESEYYVEEFFNLRESQVIQISLERGGWKLKNIHFYSSNKNFLNSDYFSTDGPRFTLPTRKLTGEDVVKARLSNGWFKFPQIMEERVYYVGEDKPGKLLTGANMCTSAIRIMAYHPKEVYKYYFFVASDEALEYTLRIGVNSATLERQKN